jgi:SpoVK/Ycf46/Vps4 family AAA+-type ATPase
VPEILDPALIRPGRIDVVILMGYPDREFRKYIAMRSAKRYGIQLEPEKAELIASLTRWFTHAEIDALVRLAASKGEGKIDEESIMWARQQFVINESMRKAIQDRLRWFAENFQGITIKYVASEAEIV